MIRTAVGIVVLVASILWLPVWIQAGLFVVAIIVLSYRLCIFIPAIVADVLYAPTHTLSLGHFKMTLFVGVLLIVWYIITTQTRLGNRYDVQTK